MRLRQAAFVSYLWENHICPMNMLCYLYEHQIVFVRRQTDLSRAKEWLKNKSHYVVVKAEPPKIPKNKSPNNVHLQGAAYLVGPLSAVTVTKPSSTHACMMDGHSFRISHLRIKHLLFAIEGSNLY